MSKLIILPNFLSEEDPLLDMPSSLPERVSKLDGIFAESRKEAGRFFAKLRVEERCEVFELNEHTSSEDRLSYLDHILQNEGTYGLLSDCGLPIIADPGADFTLLLHLKGVAIECIGVHSAVISALLLSGLGGQDFAFHGYFPKDEEKAASLLCSLFKETKKEKTTHLFIETPYKNKKILDLLLKTLPPRCWLSVAASIKTSKQRVHTRRVKDWDLTDFSLEKEPAIFLFRA